MPRATTRLADFQNAWYRPGSLPRRILWTVASRAFMETSVPWPSKLRRGLLRAFGARVGRGVVVKPRVRVKYPWNLEVGDHTWIGEDVWIDSLAKVRIGANACLSQGCMVETGNHDWSKPTFDLKLGEVSIDDGAWAAVRSLLMPGAHLASHAVLAGGSVLAGETEPYTVYAGNPAAKVRERKLREA